MWGGGEQRKLYDTTVAEGCVSQGEAKLRFDGDTWSTQYVEGVTIRTVNLKRNWARRGGSP